MHLNKETFISDNEDIELALTSKHTGTQVMFN